MNHYVNNLQGEEAEENDDNEEYDETDLYLLELHKKLTIMKNERKKAEQDSKLLDNRLNLLKTEEEKTWKRIAQTKKKTNEKIIQLQQYSLILKQKEQLKEMKSNEVQKKKEINIKFRNKIKSNIQLRKEEKMRQITEEAKLLKMQKQYNDELNKYIRSEELNTNKNKNETIRAQHLLTEEKRKAINAERKMKIKQEMEQKIMEEFRLKEEAENKLIQTEQEEIEVLKRIRTTTQVHKSLCEDLESLNINEINNKQISLSDKACKQGLSQRKSWK